MYIDNGDTWGFTLLFSNVIGKPKLFMIFARGFGWKRIQPNGKHVTNGLFIWWVWKYLKMRVDPIDVDMFAGKNVKARSANSYSDFADRRRDSMFPRK